METDRPIPKGAVDDPWRWNLPRQWIGHRRKRRKTCRRWTVSQDTTSAATSPCRVTTTSTAGRRSKLGPSTRPLYLYPMWGLLLLLTATLRPAHCSGFFELQILSIQNGRGELADGNCCGNIRGPAASSTRDRSACPQACSTFFRVCLKEYQSHVTASGTCAFGNTSSAVLGENSFTFTDPDKANAKLVLPFTFRWTVSSGTGHEQRPRPSGFFNFN